MWTTLHWASGEEDADFHDYMCEPPISRVFDNYWCSGPSCHTSATPGIFPMWHIHKYFTLLLMKFYYCVRCKLCQELARKLHVVMYGVQCYCCDWCLVVIDCVDSVVSIAFDEIL